MGAGAGGMGTGSCVSVRQTTSTVVRGLGCAIFPVCLSVCQSVYQYTTDVLVLRLRSVSLWYNVARCGVLVLYYLRKVVKGRSLYIYARAMQSAAMAVAVAHGLPLVPPKRS